MATPRIDLVHDIFGSGFSISRWYSAAHDGLDLAAKEGTPIYATVGGVVEYAKDARIDPQCGKGWACGGGNVVDINIGNNFALQYAHLQKMVVQQGQRVSSGQLIGYVGRTGGKTASGAYGGAGAQFVGSHLHFGLWDKTKNLMIDPTNYLSTGFLTIASGHTSTPSGGASTPQTPAPSATGDSEGAVVTTLDKLLDMPADTPINASTMKQITDKINSLTSSGQLTSSQSQNLLQLVGSRGVLSAHGGGSKLSDVKVDLATGYAPGISLPNIDVGGALMFVAVILVGIAFLFLGGFVLLKTGKGSQ